MRVETTVLKGRRSMARGPKPMYWQGSLLLAIPVTNSTRQAAPTVAADAFRIWMGGRRVELLTPSVSSWCSNQTELAALAEWFPPSASART